MTPRQIMAWLIIAERRIRIEKASDMNMTAIASQADGKAIKEVTDSLLKGR